MTCAHCGRKTFDVSDLFITCVMCDLQAHFSCTKIVNWFAAKDEHYTDDDQEQLREYCPIYEATHASS